MTESLVQDLLLFGKAVDDDTESHRQIFKGPLPDVHNVNYYHMDAIYKRVAACADADDLKYELQNISPGSFRSLMVVFNDREKQCGRLFVSTRLQLIS
jgi:hypothetical protein